MSDGRVPVVHVITKLELGGAQQNTLHTVASLDRERFEPWLVSGVGGMLDDEARALEGVTVRFVPELIREPRPFIDRRAHGALRELLRPLAARGPVVVHTHSSKAGVLGRLAAASLGIRDIVHTIHGFGFDALGSALKRQVGLFLERRAGRRTRALVSVAEIHLREAEQRGLVFDATRHLIRSGIDVADFARADSLRDAARAELGLAADAPVVGMIACLKPQKAPLDFLELAAAVRREHPEARFFVAGDGELRGAMEARRAELGLDEAVQLLGWRRDVPALLGALDVAVLTSRWEGLPRVCPQAMAAGRPMVAPRVDGIPEALAHGETGFLFEAGDVAAAAAHVSTLLADPALRARQAEAARAAVAPFDQDLMVRQLEALYDDLLAD